MPALFVTAEQSLDLPQPHRDALLRAYRDGVGLPVDERTRMERVMALLHVAWCGVHLQLLVPDLIEKKRFACPDLDVAAHLQDQIAKFQRRLAIAREYVAHVAW
jgi:hypothetical protein